MTGSDGCDDGDDTGRDASPRGSERTGQSAGDGDGGTRSGGDGGGGQSSDGQSGGGQSGGSSGGRQSRGGSGDGRTGNGRSSGGQSGGGQSGNGQSGGGGAASTAEKAMMVVSVLFTLLLFAYAGWQIVTPPEAAAPEATVVGTDRLSSGSVAVSVRLRNPKDVGLVSATVESNCTSPPASVQFSFVPASSTRTATLVCPPGTTDPSVSVANWVSR